MRRKDLVRREEVTIKSIVVTSTIDDNGLTNELILHFTGGYKKVMQSINHPLSEIKDDNLADSMDFSDVLCHMNVGDKVELMFNGSDYSVTFLR